ncbi:MAG: TIGR04219 family outer membrane beta-barrel protein [Desulfobacteraceae bacterium]|nr:TIGR04219 family outer membrane beta-barrel protein [Desulfobacteraceae bacterium]MBC2757514.1 TIGR04219 family outer membrane beta-barrel protein [Desulfobacteraceae bacterium]
MKKLLCVFLLICLPCTAYALPLFDIECAIGGRNISPDGSIGSDDFKSDLGFDDEWEVMGRLKVGMPLIIPNVYLVASPMEFKGSSLDSKFTLNQYDLGLYYSIPFLHTLTLKMLNVEVGLDARFMDIEADISNDSDKEDYTLPMLYLGCQFTPGDRFALEGEVWGTSYNKKDVYTLIGRVRVNMVGPLFITGGYRYDDINIREGNLRVKGNFSGLFAELGVKF